MQPSKTTVIGLFNSDFQYQIPIFQRGYVWTLEKQVGPLWTDIHDQAEAVLSRQAAPVTTPSQTLKPAPKHFLGSIVMTPVPSTFGRVGAFEVIDGQQRSTTLQLLLLALRQASLSLPNSPIPKMLEYLVRNRGAYSRDEDYYKVWPTQAGQDEIRQLYDPEETIDGLCARYPAKDGRRKIDRPLMIQTFLYLYHACLSFMRGVDLNDEIPGGNGSTYNGALIGSIRRSNEVPMLADALPLDPARAEALYMALQDQVQIMTLTLESDDDPQVIFETLNARGEPLLASDLIRNFVFLEAARQIQPVQELYSKYWSPFDIAGDGKSNGANAYWREKERLGRLASPRLDLFFYNYTILRSGESVLTSHVFQAFKAWWQKGQPRTLSDELGRIVRASKHFQELVSPSGTGYVAEFARLIKSLDVGTVGPVYLALRERLEPDSLQLKQALADLASYLTRRAICGLSSKSYGHFFLRVVQAITADPLQPHEALRQILLAATSTSEIWPDDDKFEECWRSCQAYLTLRPAKTCGILRALEYGGRGAQQASNHVPPQCDLTVEHVMPQSWRNVPSYQVDESMQHIRQAELHGFGNLTLLTQPLNSVVSNGPYVGADDGVSKMSGKRAKLGQSALLINTYFQHPACVAWDEAAIARRSRALLKAAKLVWPRPANVAVGPDKVASALSGY
ncbi:DUF262 domain-containing protein [Pseudomonas viridiflava]|uniref:DUF262 domain-containing protein n=1 Tax=Pseudomonas viridiflava TaxID=33069 RepID=A0A3M5P223_PSEVI|nr:DUF262 domain-containing protein [Pseudomonas viridiflava]RMT78227.1 hypothetical protein ALP40_03633 [Pseudomonas viridiflava]